MCRLLLIRATHFPTIQTHFTEILEFDEQNILNLHLAVDI